MTPDITISDYYNQFIKEAKDNLYKHRKRKQEIDAVIDELHDYLEDNREELKKMTINLDNFEVEFKNKEYSDKEQIYHLAYRLKNYTSTIKEQELIIQCLKYGNALRVKHETLDSLKVDSQSANMTRGEFRAIAKRYYYAMQAKVLKGEAYRFDYRLGTFMINYWKVTDKCKGYGKVLDWQATAKRKKEILDAGGKLYNDCEAAWYAARHLKYDGIDYRVYRNTSFYYNFTFKNTGIAQSCDINFEMMNKVPYGLLSSRNRNTKMYADFCHCNENEIINGDFDLRKKLAMIIYINPNNYLRYVRNATQAKYDRWAYHS